MVKKLYPLCENHLFSKAYRKGKSDANRYVAVYALRNYLRDKNGRPFPTKMGVTVNKKLGKAVKRSRAKRLIRASYRALLPEMTNGWLVVVAARTALFEKSVKSTDVTPRLRRSLETLGVIPSAEIKTAPSGPQRPKNGGKRP